MGTLGVVWMRSKVPGLCPGARRRWRPGAACPASAAGWSGSARSCAVGGGLVGLAGDGLHAQRSDVIHQPALPAPAGGVQRGPVVGQEPLGHAVGAHALVEDPDGRVTGLGPGDQPGHRQAGVIVLKLEDHALAASLQDDSRWSRLPAGVRKRGRRTASRPLGASSWARRGPRPWPARTRARDATEGASRPMETILSHHADRPVAPGPRAPPGTRVLPPPGPRSPHSDESDWSGGDGTWAPAQPPAPRRGRGPSGRRTSCARSPARRRTWSPPHAERHRATRRWQGEHGGQQAHSYSPAKHNRSVTTTTARSVTDVLTQNCHRSPETSHCRTGGAQSKILSCGQSAVPTSAVIAPPAGRRAPNPEALGIADLRAGPISAKATAGVARGCGRRR